MTNARASGRVTSRMFPREIDGRSGWGRRARDLVASFADDLGGLENLSEVKLQMARRLATLTIQCEMMEVEIAQGNDVDVDLLARLSSHMRRLAESVGLDKVPAKKPPTLADVVARIAAQKAVERDQPRAATPVAPTLKTRTHAPRCEDE